MRLSPGHPRGAPLGLGCRAGVSHDRLESLSHYVGCSAAYEVGLRFVWIAQRAEVVTRPVITGYTCSSMAGATRYLIYEILFPPSSEMREERKEN